MRPKSECVNIVTLFCMPISTMASWNIFMELLTLVSSPGWSASSVSCWSKPPTDTKKICRDIDSCAREAIILATVRSWVCSGVSVTPALGSAAKLGPAAIAALTRSA